MSEKRRIPESEAALVEAFCSMIEQRNARIDRARAAGDAGRYQWRKERRKWQIYREACGWDLLLAEEISGLGRQLYDRLRIMIQHRNTTGAARNKASGAFNAAVGSLESRVLPAARRFRDLGAATGDEIASLEGIDTQTRQLPLPPPE